MDQQELRTLKLLDEVSRNERVSQRDLARRLGVSLGLVNSFVKRLVNKGYFKVTTIPRNRLRYALTPRGMAEKSRLTLDYLRYSVNFYAEIKAVLQRTLEGLVAEDARRLVLWGTGEVAEIAWFVCGLYPVQVLGVVAPSGSGGEFLGQAPLSPRSLAGLAFDAVLVADLERPEAAERLLAELGVDPGRVRHLELNL